MRRRNRSRVERISAAAVDGLHVQGVAEHERDLLGHAQIGEPVPTEDALDADDEVFSVGRDGVQKWLRPTLHVLVQDDLPVLVENAQVHRTGVQIDAAIERMLLGVESHRGLLLRKLVTPITHNLGW
jgi:hypothetical protein